MSVNVGAFDRALRLIVEDLSMKVASSCGMIQPGASDTFTVRATFVIDPADIHYCRPGWTIVGGGIFDAQSTARMMGSHIQKSVYWLQSGKAVFTQPPMPIKYSGAPQKAMYLSADQLESDAPG